MVLRKLLGKLFGGKQPAESEPTISEADQARAKIEEVVRQVQRSTICEDAAYLINESIFAEPPGVVRTSDESGKKIASELGLAEWLKVDSYVSYVFGDKKIEIAAVNMTSWEDSMTESGSFYIWANDQLVFQASCLKKFISEAYVRTFFISVSADSLQVFRRGPWIDQIGELVFQSKQNEKRLKAEWARKKDEDLKSQARRLEPLS